MYPVLSEFSYILLKIAVSFKNTVKLGLNFFYFFAFSFSLFSGLGGCGEGWGWFFYHRKFIKEMNLLGTYENLDFAGIHTSKYEVSLWYT